MEKTIQIQNLPLLPNQMVLSHTDSLCASMVAAWNGPSILPFKYTDQPISALRTDHTYLGGFQSQSTHCQASYIWLGPHWLRKPASSQLVL